MISEVHNTVEPLKTRTSVNRNSLETEQFAKSRIFSFYFHCIKVPVNWNPSIPETGQAFYYSKQFQHYFTPLNRTAFVVTCCFLEQDTIIQPFP